MCGILGSNRKSEKNMERNKNSRKKLSKRQIMLIAAAALAVLLLAGRLAPAGSDNSLAGADIPEVQQAYQALQPADAIDEPPAEEGDGPAEDAVEPEGPAIDENGEYTSKEDVALYIHTYGRLPKNFITKSEAKKLGWEGGSLEPYAPGRSIGGDRFGNYEGLLPEAEGRGYTECDIDTAGGSSRGAKRIVFSNDGLIYYTDDHYKSFELLYGEG